jgi:hypothetical protein
LLRPMLAGKTKRPSGILLPFEPSKRLPHTAY